MDRQNLLVSNGTTLVNRLTNDIDDSTESFGTDGNLNGVSSVEDGLTTDETLSGVKSNGAHVVSTQMLGNFEHKTVLGALDFERVENGREFPRPSSACLPLSHTYRTRGTSLGRGSGPTFLVAGRVRSPSTQCSPEILLG